jgi:hypothetical protein
MLEAVLSKMSSFQKRTILFVDTLRDHTGVADRIQDLGLQPMHVHDPSEVSNKETARASTPSWSILFPWCVVSNMVDRGLLMNTNICDIFPSFLSCP